ncbi:MAG TPA: GMC family oxidoreductase N-terminal domain-containing protein [Acidimicrobiales bacterium]
MTSQEDEVADVVVVGSGPSGSVVTHTLAARGFKVVCLEQGDWVSPADYPANYPEWELLIQKQWAHDPNERRLPADFPMEVSDSDMWPVMFNAVGGSSIFYGAEWPRLLPSDFRVRTLDGVCDNWPITYADLAPYNDRIDAFIGVSGLGGDPAYPEGLDYPLPPHPLGKAGREAAEGMNALGWHWWPGTNAIPSQKFKELSQCARWGTCEWGCPESSKASSDIAFWPHALRSGATLVTGARVRKIETGRDGQATGALWIDRDGAEHRQRGSCRRRLCQRHRNTAATAAVGVGAASGRSGELLRSCRQKPDAPELLGDRLLRREPRELAGPGRPSDPFHGVLRDSRRA